MISQLFIFFCDRGEAWLGEGKRNGCANARMRDGGGAAGMVRIH